MSKFKGITGPCIYETAAGNKVAVFENDGSHSWPSVCDDGIDRVSDGDDGMKGKHDIITGPLTDEPELAGLTGTLAIRRDGGDRLDIVEIDLSTIRKDQLVRPPEPKRETWKVRLAVLDDGDLCLLRNDKAPKTMYNQDVLAIVETEIEFFHGEGL